MQSPILCPAATVDLAQTAPLSHNWGGQSIQAGRALLQGMVASARGALPFLSALRDWVAEPHLREMESLSAGLEVSLEHLLAANLSYDLATMMFGCSTVALSTPQGPVLARNLDWWPENLLARATHRVSYLRNGQPIFTTAGFPGAVAVVSGVSARGFGLVINAVMCREEPPDEAISTLLFLREVVEKAQHFDEALEWLATRTLMSPALLTLVGAENSQRVVVERTRRRAFLRWAEGEEPLLATNDYRHPDSPASSGQGLHGLLQSSCRRYETLRGLASARKPAEPVTDEQVLSWLTHSQVEQRITAQHVIIRPRQADLRVWTPARFR